VEVIQVQPSQQKTSNTPVKRAAPTVSPNPMPVVIDTDMGFDDWMAILYLLNRTEVDVKAITLTGAGETHCSPGLKNVLKLVQLAGKTNIPVACGRETPIKGDHQFPKEWREFADSLGGQDLPAGQNTGNYQDAKELLQSVLQGSSKKVTILTLGPVTNIADLLRDAPQLSESIQNVYVMGGAIKVPGNVMYAVSENKVAEWNIYIDPIAASEVLKTGIPITLVPIDATMSVPLDLDFYSKLEADHPEPEAGFLYDILVNYPYRYQSGDNYFWDALTAALMVDQSFSISQDLTICVDTKEGDTSGATLIQSGCPVTRVVMEVDRQKFENSFIDALNAP